jgi:hypothetical protein
MTTTRYDSKILQEFADKLYSQANSVVIICVVIGIIVGGLGGFMGGIIVALIGGVALGALGFAVGMSIAFQLKLRAQILLCQKQIEENTRKPALATSATAVAPPVTASGQLVARPYYFSANGINSGPHSLDEMRRFRHAGRLTDEILIAREGDKEWQPVSMFPEITFEK